MLENVFHQIGAILGLAAAGGALALFLRQPLIVAFIAVGILPGPSGVGIVVHSGEIELFDCLGIALLLFVVGGRLSDRTGPRHGARHGDLCRGRPDVMEYDHRSSGFRLRQARGRGVAP
jgi:hypothetical protein